MTHLIIHTDINKRREYLLKEVNRHLERDFTSIAQLHEIPDIHIVELTEKTSIGIDEIKALQREMIFQPFEELYQIGIIFHAQSLTTEAQNALLKTLEEVGERTMYFLLTDNERNLLQTIVSRSIKHYVKGEAKKEEEIIEERPEILDKPKAEQFVMIEEIINQDKDDGQAVKEFINSLIRYYRQEMNEGEIQISKKALQLIDDTHRKMSANVNKKMALEHLILSIDSI